MFRPIDDGEMAWLEQYETATLEHFRPRFEASAGRFDQFERVLSRLTDALQHVRAQGRQYFSAVDDAHNEICVADAILSDGSTAHSILQYEPKLPNTDKTIDFALAEDDGRLTLVDVKTIKPARRDRWAQYERALQEGWFPKDVQFLLDKDGQGGELWHTAFTSRARFLEYSLEFEQKLAAAAYGEKVRRQIMMFCGEGFHWHQDELEDFVSYYRAGAHRADDPFANAEARHINDNGLILRKTISSFGCLNRRQWETQARRVNWHVQPPQSPFSLRDAG